ncbi:MAG: MATE family efflux transporter [Clostridia bacterium]|nr:MATE family efflux transporter [Clostridia bacterium]
MASRDMTKGSERTHLIAYAWPLILGNLLQLAYNAVDSIIAGRFIGKEALAAEGVAGPVMNLVILAISGMCIGAGVLMSEFFGAGKKERLRETVGTMLLSGGAVCLAVTLLGLALTPVLLYALQVPGDIFDIAVLYLRVTFLGAPFTFLYNALSAALKSVGDTKTPLWFLACSAILNAVLDLIFLGIFRFGILCSAVTTVVAEAVSAMLALIYLRKKVRDLWPGKGEWRIERTLGKKMLHYGLPTALQQAIQPICKLLIQGNVNALGLHAIAAFHACTRVDDFACIPEQSISSGMSTLIAQNRGAGKQERIRRGFLEGMKLEASYWVLIGLVTMIFRRYFVAAFVTGEGADTVITLGSEYLFYMAFFYLWPAMTNGVQGYFRGMGQMGITMVSTFIQAGLRALCSFFLTKTMGISGIAISSCIGWSCMLLFEVPLAVKSMRSLKTEKST